jgi:Ca2+-binding EF-hand superfamily protein
MKHWKWIGLAALLCALSLVALGAGPAGQGPRGARGRTARAQGLIARFDANGDGQVSEGEWADAFRKLDANNDGVVTKEELREHAEQARENAWKKLDTDGDGALSIDEFPGRDNVFKRIDADGDGLLTKEELAAAREKLRRWRQHRMRQGRPGWGARRGPRDGNSSPKD